MRFHSLVIFTLGSGVVHAGLLQKTLEKIRQVPVAMGLHFKKSQSAQFQLAPMVDPNPSAKYDMEGSSGDSPDGSHLPISRMRDPGLNRHNRVQSIPQHHPPRNQLPTRHISFSGQKYEVPIYHGPINRQERRFPTHHISFVGQKYGASTRHIPPNEQQHRFPTHHISFVGQKYGASTRHTPPDEQEHELPIYYGPISRQKYGAPTRHKSFGGQKYKAHVYYGPISEQKHEVLTRHKSFGGQEHESSHPPSPELAQNPLSDIDKAKYIKQLEETIKTRTTEVAKLKAAKDQCTADLEEEQKDLMQPAPECKLSPELSKLRIRKQSSLSLTDKEVILRMIASSEEVLHEAKEELKAVMS
ncbi:hypothetical protein BASA50_000161 [Batrachochytrium salamandrivorans]|uniref:Enkurin domain-containing protein n=1 Tax=Batrachochytrium salamandrivorans TaxID=1357716 RepID=A0ABQ8EUG9_9FUNG|nr:hypothetical protein BASA50_000161 [Batrachochytrium salamandrivorans]